MQFQYHLMFNIDFYVFIEMIITQLYICSKLIKPKKRIPILKI